MTKAVQQPPTVITQPTRINTHYPETLYQLNINISVTRGLAVAHIAIGAITMLLGIAAAAEIPYYWVYTNLLAIAVGIWVIITGTLGVCSCRQNQNSCLNGTHMAFCIIAMVGSITEGCMFVSALRYYNNCGENYRDSFRSYYRKDCSIYLSLGRGLDGILLSMMILNFFVSLVAFIYCCEASPTCFGTKPTGLMLQEQQPQQYIITTTGQMSQQQLEQPYKINKADYDQQTQPMVSQQPMEIQESVMMYLPKTGITQPDYPSLSNPSPVYQEDSLPVPPPCS